MMRRISNKKSGFTLVECVVVITLTAGLFAAMLSSSGVALQAHVGQAALEQKQFEGQRAAMELKYLLYVFLRMG
jgi:prepilin-type N-terminal cleavage/methylation domain-containing protein